MIPVAMHRCWNRDNKFFAETYSEWYSSTIVGYYTTCIQCFNFYFSLLVIATLVANYSVLCQSESKFFSFKLFEHSESVYISSE